MGKAWHGGLPQLNRLTGDDIGGLPLMLRAEAAASPRPVPSMLNKVGPTCPTAPMAAMGELLAPEMVNAATPVASPCGIRKLICPGDT